MSGSQGSSTPGQEYIVRLPRASKKKYNVMQFTSVSKAMVDIPKLTQVRMERENNMKEFKADDDAPKYGAGSEFGRDQREEARRKKHGIILRKYNPDGQPWILKIGGKGGKKYKGIRGGGIRENASYYVFTQAADGAFEASPIEEWYNFSPIQRYKALSAEEAEEEFGRRDRVFNYFTIMLKKRLKKEEEGDADGEEKTQDKKKKKKGKQSSEFKLTDEDWGSDSDNESDDEGEEGEANKEKSKTPKKAKKKSKNKKKNDSDEEAMEESDEGDFDTKEVDYISECSSSSEEEADDKVNQEMKGVEDEEALAKLSEDEAEEEKKEGAENEENPEDKAAAEQKTKQPKDKKGGSSGESSGETSDSDFDDSNFQSAMFMQKTNKKKTGSDNSAGNSRANTPTKMLGDGQSGQQKSMKRKLDSVDGAPNTSKRQKNEVSSLSNMSRNLVDISQQGSELLNRFSSAEGITDDAVRRYLMRKPMTTTELLQKFRSTGKKAGVSGNELVTTIAKILKRLNPEKQTIKGKLYLSIKS